MNLEFIDKIRIGSINLGDIMQMIFRVIGMVELIQEKNVEREMKKFGLGFKDF